MQPLICADERAKLEARKHVSVLVLLMSLCTTKWRARALDHKDSRVRHERRDTFRFENFFPLRTFLRTFEVVHSCMHVMVCEYCPPAGAPSSWSWCASTALQLRLPWKTTNLALTR